MFLLAKVHYSPSDSRAAGDTKINIWIQAAATGVCLSACVPSHLRGVAHYSCRGGSRGAEEARCVGVPRITWQCRYLKSYPEHAASSLRDLWIWQQPQPFTPERLASKSAEEQRGFGSVTLFISVRQLLAVGFWRSNVISVIGMPEGSLLHRVPGGFVKYILESGDISSGVVFQANS